MSWLIAPIAFFILVIGHRRRLRLAHEADIQSALGQIHLQHQRRLDLLGRIEGAEAAEAAPPTEAALAEGAARAAEALSCEEDDPARRELRHVEARLASALSLYRALVQR